MRTLILYATKHGAARDIAQRLAKRMNGATVIDLGTGSAPSPNGYDRVIIGSSVYVGQLRKEAKAYAAQHADALKAVTLGLFVSGLSPEDVQAVLDANYPKDVATHAKAAMTLGGAFQPDKAGFFERLAMRVITKTAEATSTISDEKIDRFAEVMRA